MLSLRPIIVLLLFSIPLLSQTPDTATLQGTVMDATQSAVPGAHIVLTNELTGLVRKTLSDGLGHFSLGGLPVAGQYSVSATKEGFAAVTADQISVAGGSSASLRLTLRVAGETSTISVEGTADDVRVDQPQLGIHLSQQQMQETPLPARRITYLPLLDAANRPAISQGDIFMNENLFTTNGAGRRQTWFEVDGANAIDMWGRQTIFSNIPLMAVDEMAVLTNSFSAEYGATTGSVVNIVTRSGGDQLHGQLLELWRPASTGASLEGFTSGNATSGNEITSDVLGQTAASLSGPLGRWQQDALFLRRRVQPRGQGFADHFAARAGKLRGPLSRLAWPCSPGPSAQRQEQHISPRQLSTTSTDTNPNGIVGGSSLATVARIFRRRTYTGELGDTAVLNAHLLNNARLQFQLGSPITEFDPVVYGTQFVVPISSSCGSTACGTFTSGTSQSALLMNRQYEFSEILAYNFERHQLTFGGDVIAAHNGGNSKEFGGPIFLGKFTYNTCSQPAGGVRELRLSGQYRQCRQLSAKLRQCRTM